MECDKQFNDECDGAAEVIAPNDRDRARFGFKKRPNVRGVTASPGQLTPSPRVETVYQRADSDRVLAELPEIPAHLSLPRFQNTSIVPFETGTGPADAAAGSAVPMPVVAKGVADGIDCPPNDLLGIFDAELGDVEAHLALLRQKPRAGRYDFKEQIEELKNVVKPLKDSLGDRLRREKLFRDAIMTREVEVSKRLGEVEDVIRRERMALEEKMARREEAHSQDIRVWQCRLTEMERAWQQKELVQERATAERDRQIERQQKNAMADITKRIQDTKEDCNRQLADASRLLETQISDSKQAMNDLQQAARLREETIVSQWTEKLDETNRVSREKETKLSEELLQQSAKAQQAYADLEAKHARALELLTAEWKERENQQQNKHLDALAVQKGEMEELRLNHAQREAGMRSLADQQTANAQRDRQQMEAAHDKRIAEMQVQFELSAAEASRRERQLEADNGSRLREVEARAQRRELDQSVESAQKLSQVEARAHEREQDLASKMEEQAARFQQTIAELRRDLDASAAAARAKEEDLKTDLRSSTFKAKQIDDELTALRDRFSSMETRLQNELLEAGTKIRRLESGLATERGKHERESSAKSALESERTKLLETISELRNECRDLQGKQSDCQERVAELMKESRAAEFETNQLRDAVAEEQARLQNQRRELDSTVEKLSSNRQELAEASSELSLLRDKSRRLSAGKRELDLEFRSYKEHNTTSNQAQMQAITDLKITVDKLTQKVDCAQLEIGTKNINIANHEASVHTLQQQLAAAENSRRELHNTIQELRGNIRVFCRVRPKNDEGPSSITVPEDNKLTLHHSSESYIFPFDKVFGSSSVQEELFHEVSGVVQSALDGYKVCVFAYGQTGSGKTYTMQGGHETHSWGLIPRSLRQIFKSSEDMQLKGWKWSLKVSFMEVYNEVIRDLLRDEETSLTSNSGNGAKASTTTGTPQCHVIKHDSDWGTMVTNMTCVNVSSIEQINSLMASAAKLRAVGSTDMNSVSSRSHSIFALYLSGSNVSQNTELRGALHLVDLAGSERLDKSGAVGDRLKETQNINRSLSSLADVFSAKAEGRAHVPFRNSKLTHLMEPCLSGHGKTLMAVNVGPEADNSHETLCSLRFASQVSQCTTGGRARRSAKTLNRHASNTTMPSSAIRRGGC